MGFENEEQARAYYLEHHPTLKRLAEGEATFIASPFGLLWFGPDDGLIKWSWRALMEYATAPPRFLTWPERFESHIWTFNLVSVEESGWFATYRRQLDQEDIPAVATSPSIPTLSLAELLANLQARKPNTIAITFNDHWCLYETAAESDAVGNPKHWFVSEEDRRLCIETNSIWEVRWYVQTPVGCVVVYASTLEIALEALLRARSMENHFT